MPNTGNLSVRENPTPWTSSISMTTSIPPARLQAHPSPLTQNTTLSEKSFPMSDKRTMSYISLTHVNNLIPSRLLPPPFIRRQAPTPPPMTPIMPIMPITTGVLNTNDMTTSTLQSQNLCALSKSKLVMQISLKQRSVGATYHVARNHKSQRQRATRLIAPTRLAFSHDLLASTSVSLW